MNLREEFSVAICPQDDIIKQVSLIKKDLRKIIPDYGSKNSDAHITFNTFLAYERELASWKTCVTSFCKCNTSFVIRFEKIDTFENGTLFLAPAEEAGRMLARMMKQFNGEKVSLRNMVVTPHLTIARGLTYQKNQYALDYFKYRTFNLEFTCNDLAIRKLDNSRKQYRVESRFQFKGKAEND